MALPELTKRVRKSLELTQEEFAHELQVASSSVGNWESGRKRPAPKFLRRMAELAPRFAEDVEREIKRFEWHPSPRRYSSEVIAQLHEALDVVLDRAPSAMVEEISRLLTTRAGKRGSKDGIKALPGGRGEHSGAIPTKLWREAELLAAARGEDPAQLVIRAIDRWLYASDPEREERGRMEKKNSARRTK